jgi:hypothetical protein
MPRVALITHAHYIDIDWLREEYRRFVAVGNRILFNPSGHGQDVVLGSESAFTPGPLLAALGHSSEGDRLLLES